MKAGTRKRRSAAAYERLSYKLSTPERQRAVYVRRAEQLRREADRLDAAAAERERWTKMTPDERRAVMRGGSR